MGAFTFFRTALKEQCLPRKQTWKLIARLITASSQPQGWAEMLILRWSLICRCGWWLFIKSHHKFLEHRFILRWSMGSRLARQSTHWGLAHVEQTRTRLMMGAAAEARLMAIAREGLILVWRRWFSKILTCYYCTWYCYVLLSSCRNPTVQYDNAFAQSQNWFYFPSHVWVQWIGCRWRISDLEGLQANQPDQGEQLFAHQN